MKAHEDIAFQGKSFPHAVTLQGREGQPLAADPYLLAENPFLPGGVT